MSTTTLRKVSAAQAPDSRVASGSAARQSSASTGNGFSPRMAHTDPTKLPPFWMPLAAVAVGCAAAGILVGRLAKVAYVKSAPYREQARAQFHSAAQAIQAWATSLTSRPKEGGLSNSPGPSPFPSPPLPPPPGPTPAATNIHLSCFLSGPTEVLVGTPLTNVVVISNTTPALTPSFTALVQPPASAGGQTLTLVNQLAPGGILPASFAWTPQNPGNHCFVVTLEGALEGSNQVTHCVLAVLPTVEAHWTGPAFPLFGQRLTNVLQLVNRTAHALNDLKLVCVATGNVRPMDQVGPAMPPWSLSPGETRRHEFVTEFSEDNAQPMQISARLEWRGRALAEPSRAVVPWSPELHVALLPIVQNLNHPRLTLLGSITNSGPALLTGLQVELLMGDTSIRASVPPESPVGATFELAPGAAVPFAFRLAAYPSQEVTGVAIQSNRGWRRIYRLNPARAGTAPLLLEAIVVTPEVAVTPTRTPKEGRSGVRVYTSAPTNQFPMPPFPRRAFQRHESGTVELLVNLHPSGTVASIDTLSSSGPSILATEARRWVQERWRWPSGSANQDRVSFRFQPER